MTENHVQLNFRVPEALRERLKEIAESNRRSMGSQIVVLLERAIYDPLETKKGEAA